MNLVCSSFKKILNSIEDANKKIVLFGAGVLGQVTTPEILKSYGLLDYVLCYIDNDKSKWGTTIDLYGRQFVVNAPDYLNSCNANTVIILNISRYADVLKQLEEMDCTRNMDCYLMGMMCIHNFCRSTSFGDAEFSNQPLIPKKIHYMWLGGKEKPSNLQKCIDSWKEFCPDYEVVEWNEDNYDLNKHPYMRDAYNAGAYGFVPDYARLDILHEHGGIYLDTDVELKKNLDSLLCQEAFCGVEKWQVLNFGGCSGATKGSQTIKRFLDARENVLFTDENGKQNKNTCGFYDTKVAIELGYKLNGTTQHIDGMNIYAYDYFHPYDYMSGNLNVTEHTYSIHWFNGGWLDDEKKEANRKTSLEYNDLYRLCVVEG